MKRSIFLLFAIVSVAGMIAISGCKKKETYTVTFNANGGTGTMEAQTFTEGEAQALTRNAFSYDGYTFTGWNTVQGGSGTSYSDQQTITATADMTLYAQWISNGTNPTPDPTPGPTPPEPYVDLGLPSGLLWATCNVGANTPEEYGDYFAWGETTTKETYNWATYKYCNGSSNTLTKYCELASHGYNGFTDNLYYLEESDDAATANWGVGWRVPKATEFQELMDYCTVTWTIQNEVKGRLFTSNINGNSIFLPAAGLRDGDSLDETGYAGDYWARNHTGDGNAWFLRFTSSAYSVSTVSRHYGLTVRPVFVSAKN